MHADVAVGGVYRKNERDEQIRDLQDLSADTAALKEAGTRCSDNCPQRAETYLTEACGYYG